jgi:hypothetical protein
MDSKRDISKLNWALGVYTDIIKFGINSSRIDENKLCLEILEEFEEYEKCYDIFLVLSNQDSGVIDKISKGKKK